VLVMVGDGPVRPETRRHSADRRSGGAGGVVMRRRESQKE
jgi:hypothetical protein